MTAQEIFDQGIWDKFCEVHGINPWAINEGRMDLSHEFELSATELMAIEGKSCIPLPTLPDEMEFIDGVFVLYQWEGHRLAFRIEDDRSWGFHLEIERKNGTWHSYNMIPESLKALLGLPPGVKIYKMYRLNKEGNKIVRKG